MAIHFFLYISNFGKASFQGSKLLNDCLNLLDFLHTSRHTHNTHRRTLAQMKHIVLLNNVF